LNLVQFSRLKVIMPFYNKNFGAGTFSSPYADKDAFNYFAIGYRRAAETLARSLLRRRGFMNCEAYPVFFLYRHAFELSLKHALYKAAEYAAYSGNGDFLDSLHNRHELRPLAKLVVDSLKELFPDDGLFRERQLLSRITDTSNELDAIDSSSFIFRYPIDTKGEPAAKIFELMNLKLFARHMSALLEDIDTVNVALDNLSGATQDAFTEWFRANASPDVE
jgi:hypothetical protein